MDRPGDPQIPPPPAPTVEHCYRHPTEPTRVHCTRCGRPICPECMIPAPVGHQCPECVQQARREFRQGPGKRIAVRSVTATKVFLVAILGVFVLEMVAAGAGSMGRRMASLRKSSRRACRSAGAMRYFFAIFGRLRTSATSSTWPGTMPKIKARCRQASISWA